MSRKRCISTVLPVLLAILFFAFGFTQVMFVQYGQIEHVSGKGILASVDIVYPDEIEYTVNGIDPNNADLETLCILPGVGKVTAQAFHDELLLNGPFFYPEDLLAVKGIGEKKLENIRPLIRLH